MLLNLKYFKQFITNDTLQYFFYLCERSVSLVLSVRKRVENKFIGHFFIKIHNLVKNLNLPC